MGSLVDAWELKNRRFIFQGLPGQSTLNSISIWWRSKINMTCLPRCKNLDCSFHVTDPHHVRILPTWHDFAAHQLEVPFSYFPYNKPCFFKS